MPLGGPQSGALAPSRAPTHHFPCRSRPRSLQAPNGGRGCREHLSLRVFPTSPPTAQLSPRTHLGLSLLSPALLILAASAPPQHSTRRPAEGRGGAGAAAAGCSAPSPGPGPLPPATPTQCALPHARPPLPSPLLAPHQPFFLP